MSFYSMIILIIIPFFLLVQSGLLYSERSKFGGESLYLELLVPIYILFTGIIPFLTNAFVGLFFGIGILPLILLYRKGSYMKTSFYWLLVTTLSFLIASFIGTTLTVGFGMIELDHEILMYIFTLIGVAVSCYFLINQYSKLLIHPLGKGKKYAFILLGLLLASLLLFIMGGVKLIGGWGTNIGIDIGVIIFWHIFMSILLFILKIKH